MAARDATGGGRDVIDERVEVTGVATRRVPPELVFWSVLVEVPVAGDDAPAAFGRCGEVVRAVVERLERAVPGERTRLRTGRVALRGAQEDWDGREREAAAVASIDVRVAAADAERAAAEALAAGATGLDGPRTGLVDPDAHALELAALAVEDARRRAAALSEAAGRTLGPALVIRDEHHGDVHEGIAVAATAGFEPGVPVEPPDVRLSASVSVTFGLT